MGALDTGSKITIDGDTYVVDRVDDKLKGRTQMRSLKIRTTTRREVTLVGHIVREEELEEHDDR